jgi:zinc/manganese transport system substrate-binding protein
MLLAVAGCSAGTTGASSPSSGTIGVVAGENFWGDIVSQIGGSHVKVTSIVSDPNADPHEYEASAADAAALASAQFVLENGVGYDDFMGKLLKASPNSNRDVLSVAKILDVTGDSPNPHLWYDTPRLHEVSAAIAKELSKREPSHRSEFEANAKKFDESLQPILDVIATIKSKYAGTPVAYTERVPGYLLTAAGLTLGMPASFTAAVEQGNDPTAADTAAFLSAIKNKDVKVLLYNGQVTDAETDDIKKTATDAGVPIVGVTETIPTTDKDFQSWQLRQVTELAKALGN